MSYSVRIVVGKNKKCLWLKTPDEKIILEWFGSPKSYKSYFQSAIVKFLSFYISLPTEGRRKYFVPNFQNALDVCRRIQKYELYRYKGFRAQFNELINLVNTPEEFIKKLDEITSRYAARRAFQTIFSSSS